MTLTDEMFPKNIWTKSSYKEVKEGDAYADGLRPEPYQSFGGKNVFVYKKRDGPAEAWVTVCCVVGCFDKSLHASFVSSYFWMVNSCEIVSHYMIYCISITYVKLIGMLLKQQRGRAFSVYKRILGLNRAGVWGPSI